MAWTVWAFRFQEDNWRRVPWAWYERFIAGRELLQEPEGTLVRFAQCTVELEEREPVRLGQLWFGLHEIGGQGTVNQEREEQSLRSALEMIGPFGLGDGKVIDAAPRFAKRRYQHLATWEPSLKEKMALLQTLRSLFVPC